MQTRPNPAPFTPVILDHFEEMVKDCATLLHRPPLLLDPFAGTGRIHRLADAGIARTVGVELEPEWAAHDPRTIVANATRLPFPAGRFDAVGTSPCMAQEHRMLTNDLRWVAAGDVSVGDEMLAYDETGSLTGRGFAARRRWRRTVVVRSVPRRTQGVRVILANGDEIITTPNHPWLASRYAGNQVAAEWVMSKDLGDTRPIRRRSGATGLYQPWYVQRQVEPWTARTSYDAGWLAGLFDGEGSLSLGQHGSPKLQLCQAEGDVVDHAERLMTSFGYKPNRISRKSQPAGRQPLVNLYVTQGFPGLLRALGELRPRRLLNRWSELDISTRTVQAEKVGIIGVEPAGLIDIQEIETSEGTYFGEGYLMHNSYGNRFSDSHQASDACKRCDGTGRLKRETGPDVTCTLCKGTRLSPRRSYTHYLGRRPSRGSSAAMRWGDPYRFLHERAWAEARRVLRLPQPGVPGPWLILNISDFYRSPGKGQESELQPVTDWHVVTLGRLGFVPITWHRVPTPRSRHGANRQRAPHENVILFELR